MIGLKLNRIVMPMAVVASDVSRVFRPIIAGSVAALWAVMNAVGFAGLIFAGALSPLFGPGLVAILMGYTCSAVIVAFASRWRGMTTSIVAPAVAIHAAAVSALLTSLPAAVQANPDQLLGAALAINAGLTLVTGFGLLGVGILRLGMVAQWLPYPVVSGYNAGIGYLFLIGGLKLGMTGSVHEAVTAPFSAAQGQALLSLLCGLALLILPQRLRHWSVMPGLLLGGIFAFHLVRLSLGLDVAQVQAQGWTFGPFPATSAHWSFAPLALDWGTVFGLWRYMAADVFLAAVTLILALSALENDLNQRFDFNRELNIAGLGSLCAGAFGGLPSGPALATTTILNRQGGATRLGALMPAFWSAALFLAGSAALGSLPRFVVAGLLLSVGFERLVLRLWRDRTILSRLESGVALLVAAGIPLLGIVDGLLLGLAAAVLLFAWNYRRIPVIGKSLVGGSVRSHVVRGAQATKLLQSEAKGIAVYQLQGYLFFLNVAGIQQSLDTQSAATPLTHLILDFTRVVGMDSSAVMGFRKLEQMAAAKGFQLVMAGLSAHDLGKMRAWGFPGAYTPVARSTDEALEHAENDILARNNWPEAKQRMSLAEALSLHLGTSIGTSRLAPFITRHAFKAGTRIIRMGEKAESLYYVEAGQVTAELPQVGKAPLRLQTCVAGALVGEIALFVGGIRTADVLATTDCVLDEIKLTDIARMKAQDTQLALHLQTYLMQQLAGRLAETTRRIEL